MNARTKLTIACISATILSAGFLAGAVAQTPPYVYEDGTEANSRGIIEIGNAKFDSLDLKNIHTEVNTGKTAIATAIKNADLKLDGNKGEDIDLTTIYTFSQLAEGVNPWDDIQEGLGYYSKDSEGNYTKANGKRNNLYDTVNNLDSLDKAIAADNQASYAQGLNDGRIDASLTSQSVEIHYHQHESSCYGVCGSTSYRDVNNNPNGWDYIGNGNWAWSTSRYCSVCGASMGTLSGWQDQNDYDHITDNRRSTCTATVLKCGKDTHTLEYLVINGVRYEP